VKDRVSNDIGAEGPVYRWADINWKLIQKRIKNLRQRIYRATQQRRWNQVRSLTKLMLRSQANLLLSIKRVTQINRGKGTAGVDGLTFRSTEEREWLWQKMQEYTPWIAKPARRVYIPKSNGKQRPLGIPTVQDRVLQAVVKNALEPSWEARFEANSFGFRPGRSVHDAITQCHSRLRKGHDLWVLDADIKGAFDHISHGYILDAIGAFPGRELIKQWLKAGYIESDVFHKTPSGVPQGGVISPLLANIALDGLGAMLDTHRKVSPRETSRKAKHGTYQRKLPKYGFIRYADDFVITARSEEDLKVIVPEIQVWLKQRGLELNQEKTQIVQVTQGFNFLGFTIRHFNGHCIIRPQKDKVLAFLNDIRAWLKRHSDIKQEDVIRYLNPRLKGWCNYYRYVASKRVFSYVEYQLWKALWKWSCRRHRNKGKRWIAKKYFQTIRGRSWIFAATAQDRDGKEHTFALTQVYDTPITRHRRVKGTFSPDDPTLSDYWRKRRTGMGKVLLAPGSKLYKVAQSQRWQCQVCGEHLYNGETLQTHHKQPVKEGGGDDLLNLELVHKACHNHRHVHGRRLEPDDG
jgi:RNA-directed DNA polymerase